MTKEKSWMPFIVKSYLAVLFPSGELISFFVTSVYASGLILMVSIDLFFYF